MKTEIVYSGLLDRLSSTKMAVALRMKKRKLPAGVRLRHSVCTSGRVYVTSIKMQTDSMEPNINLKVNIRGNYRNLVLTGPESRSWEALEATVR